MSKSLNADTFSIKKYSHEYKPLWNDFLRSSKNGTFLFERDFLEYHLDRFEDFSLLVFKNSNVVAILPANVENDQIFSHQGLTYGGLVLDKKIKLRDVALVFQVILKYYESHGIKTCNIKQVPRIYHSFPADELDYLLFLTDALRIRTDVWSVIDNNNSINIASNRLEGVKKGVKNNLSIVESKDFASFWDMVLEPNLELQHNASPVHSSDEIEKLAIKFPQNIHQFNVLHNGKIVGGTTIFETRNVAHTQYISASEEGKLLGTLDFLFDYLIKERFKNKRYFDFGASTLNEGKKINGGLQYWKECFGARSISQDFYEVPTANHTKLDSIVI